MISTITKRRMSTPTDPSARTTQVGVLEQTDYVDSRSSSLSDLDDTAEERIDIPATDTTRRDDMEADSEAETELLTPRKPNTTTLDANPPLQTTEISPSKLIQELIPVTPGFDHADDTMPQSSNRSMLSSPSAQPNEDHTDDTSKILENEGEPHSLKRKRTTSPASSLSEFDEPLAKRSHASRFEAEPPTSPAEGTIVQDIDVDGPTERTQDNLPPAHGFRSNGAGLEDESNIDAPLQPVPARGGGRWAKGKKGKKKGKRPFGASAHDNDTVADSTEIALEDEMDAVEAEAEEEGSSLDGELVMKKRHALDAFSGIEKDFAAFRERHVNDQLAQVNRDLELLEQNLQPEYLAMQRCVDSYRDRKVHHETAFFKYRRQALDIKLVAERDQLHSQYFQELREIRDKSHRKCQQHLYALQKDRRRWGADEANYNYLYNPKRAQQIQQQASYNLEVSILSGIAKHVGFPAAPDITGLQETEIESDFQAMTIPSRTTQPRISLREAERNAGENGFFEREVWANPIIANAMLQSRPSPNMFATPPAQQRLSEMPATNGSSSTVELMMSVSEAPSSLIQGQRQTPQEFFRHTETPLQNAKTLATLGNISKPPSRLHDKTDRIRTTHSLFASAGRRSPSASQSTQIATIETGIQRHVIPALNMHPSFEPREIAAGSLSQPSSSLNAPVGTVTL